MEGNPAPAKLQAVLQLGETRHRPSAPRNQDMPFELRPANSERSFGYIVAPDGKGAVVHEALDWPQTEGQWLNHECV
ncbi:unnamed protein product [Rangifer tarandus platyrhynchus]|uniref:Uncharacterized protein n=2 Tax=Rangifer tarandus platyrhynchus TaxID=3082113 RepID=A0AC60A3T9_RANTA|nr:unnamed protein product [Rangifer tarandus platyrhynchus]